LSEEAAGFAASDLVSVDFEESVEVDFGVDSDDESPLRA
jgi:hypothetical protein